MQRRWVGGIQRFVVMWAAVTAIVTIVVLAFATLILIGFYGHRKELTSSEICEIVLNAILYDGRMIALLFAVLYLAALLAAVGISRLAGRLHWFAFLAAGLFPLLVFAPLIVQSGQLQNLTLIGLLGATVGWLAGWIWSRRPPTPPPQQPA